MFKKLDKLIIKAFLGPFIITFFIAVFVLMMQILWKYIDDLVGKGLDFLTIAKFLWYASASLLTLAMPIAILISSIMTFGNLGESFELVAIKSSGISLLRFMRPLVYVTLVLCGITFIFANYVIPVSQLKFAALYSDIFYKKPAFELREGVFFTQIPSYAIRVNGKDKEGNGIRDVLIYEQGNALQDNTIKAESGTMNMSEDESYIELRLKNGFRYQERGNYYDSSTEYTRLKFKEFKKLLDMSAFRSRNSPDSVFKDNFRMLSARQLNKTIEKIGHDNDSIKAIYVKNLKSMLAASAHPDSLWKATPAGIKKPMFPDSAKYILAMRAGAKAQEIKSSITFQKTENDNRNKNLVVHQIEWHRKFSLSLACLVLFFIGGPLGSIIRKGGLGMPLLIAIIMFLIFHLLNMFGEKFVKENLMAPHWGMWLATIVLAPVGAFLTYKAMHDSQLFNKDAYLRAAKAATKFIKRIKSGKNEQA